MTTINGVSGFGTFPFLYQSAPKPSAAADAIARSLGTSGASGASATTAAQADLTATALTGFAIAPKLSAGVIDALLKHQTLQSAASVSSAADTTTNLSGASATASQPDASSNSQSGPETLQQIAGQFDPHNLTHQQEEQLQGDLVSSGALSQKDGFHFFDKTVLSDFFDSQHYRIINGQLVATTPSAPGTIIGNDAPGGQQYDAIQRFQQSLAFDQSVGNTQSAAEDQKVLNVLNQIDALRKSSGAAATSTA